MKDTLRPGYKQTEVGVIPEDWQVSNVGDSFEVCNQLRLPLSQAVRERMFGPYPYYGPTSVQGWINEYRVEGQYALIGEDGDHFLKWKIQPMTLLVQGKFNVNNHAHLVCGTKNLTDWFYWIFANRDLTQFLTRQGAGRYKLTKAALLQIPCALPSLPEQRAIAAALSDVDALLAKLDQLIAKKRDLKQAAMQQLLTGQTRLPGFSGAWEVKRLGDVGTFVKGSGIKKDEARSGDIPCIRYGEIYTHHNDYVRAFNSWISPAVAATATALKQGDLLFAGSGETKEEIGKCVAFVDVLEAYAGGDIVILRPRSGNSLFLGYYCNTTPINAQKACRGQGDAVVHISAKALSEIEIALPCTEEQSAIATILSDMDAEITALEARRDKTRALKQGMMQELLTGRTRLV